ncbi:protein STPG4 isoform X2 [Choloepus didactylus]|nr:protein STPG4 isoform X2 [Choloepus didactylus]
MDQPVVAITAAAVRDELRRSNPLFPTTKPIRKTSSFEREGWWRIALTDTPIPGTYHLKTFIEESLLNPVIGTYNFKNEGRKKPPLIQRNNPVLNDIPQYMPPDFLDLLKKQTTTYSFKDKARSSPSTLVYKDQSVQLSPGQYEILPAPVPKHASSSKIPNRLLHSS